MTDLAQLVTGTRVVEILHPGTKLPLGVRVPVVSTDDESMAKIKRAITDRRLHLDQRGKAFKAEEIDDNLNNILFAAMRPWTWYNPTGEKGDDGYDPSAMPSFNGEVPEFNKRNVIAVFERLSWFRDQINEAVAETEAFFSNSAPN